MKAFSVVPCAIWRQDNWFAELPPDAKLVWLWMQTNEHAAEPWQFINFDQISMETGISTLRVIHVFEGFKQSRRLETEASYFRTISPYSPRCARCGTNCDMTIDHVLPRAWGGLDAPDNFQWLCRRCNSAKGAHHATRY